MMKRTLGGIAVVSAIACSSPALAGGLVRAETLEPVITAPPVAEDFWTGFYFGGALGYDTATHDMQAALDYGVFSTDIFIFDEFTDDDAAGGVGAWQVGYNYQFRSGFVVGVQLDGTIGSINTNVAPVADTPIPFRDVLYGNGYDLSVSNMNTLSLRGGFLATPDTQVYGLVGYSRASVDLTVRAALQSNFFGFSNFDEESEDFSFDLTGVTFGAGVETRVTDSISIGAEYRMTDFEEHTLSSPERFGLVDEFTIDTTIQTVRVFANYRF